MFHPIKCSSRTLTLLIAYPFFAAGQLWLYFSKVSMPELSDRLTIGSSDWVNAHLLLIISLLLIIKAYLAISDYLRPTKGGWMASLAVFLTAITVFVLLGQYIIDLVFVEVFRLPKDLAQQTMERIQANPVLSALFTGDSSLLNIFRVVDLPLVANALLGASFIASKKIPRWAIWVYFIAFFLSNFGRLLHPEYGILIKRSSYVLFSVAFYPVAIGLWKKPAVAPKSSAMSQENREMVTAA